MSHDQNKLGPTTMTPTEVARLLSRVGEYPVTVEMIDADVVAGMPTNANGTMNLLHVAAWLLKEMGRGD
jgi:hypothetical protein